MSEDYNPVIIEYKIKESSELITQSLFYLDWIHDHKGDFEIAVQKSLGNEINVDWSDIRVICIAPNFKKYDLHAVKRMKINIELWKYRLFSNNSLYLDDVYQSTEATPISSGQRTKTDSSNKVATFKDSKTQYSFEDHLNDKTTEVKAIMLGIREFMLNLDPSIKEISKKSVIAYRSTQSFVWILTRSKNQLKIRLRLDEKDVIPKPKIKYRDTTKIDWALGNSEFILTKEEDVEVLKPYIELAYNKIGG